MKPSQAREAIKAMIEKMTDAELEDNALDNGGEIVIRTEIYLWDCGSYHSFEQETKTECLLRTAEKG
jgi:methylmalonyl-CoA mutase cobalamin-binding subunit